MIEVVRYTSDRKKEWDGFVSETKNGTFLFERDFMEYHTNKFDDYSLMLYENYKLKAVFPGNYLDNTFYSHQGLTFGGILTLEETDSVKFILYFNNFNNYLDLNNIDVVFYKPVPQIYKTSFGDEELYVMYRVNAQTVSVNLSSCLDLSGQINISRNRKRNYVKSLKEGVVTNESNDWDGFWSIMINNMQDKYKATPVHSLSEILKLHKLFPNQIKLYATCINNRIVAGAVIFKYKNIIKIQYAHSNQEGLEKGAIDNCYSYIINKYKNTFKYVDFGSSNLNSGLFLYEGLIRQKEGFGARGVVFNTFKYLTKYRIE